MSILGRLFDRRALSPLQAWISDIGYGAIQTDSGIVATQANSAALPAVYACTSLIAETISTLPVDSYIDWNGAPKSWRPRPPWLDQPVPNDPSMTRIAHVSQLVLSLLFDGNAFVHALPSVYDPQVLLVLDPSTVQVKQDPSGRPMYSIRTAGGLGPAATYTPDEIVHVARNRRPGAMRGMSPIDEAKQAIGGAIATQKFAGRFFRNGAVMTGVIETAAEMTQDQANTLRDKFTAGHSGDNAHKVGILTSGATFKPMSVTPEQAQFLETRKYDTLEVARLFRVPPLLIQVNDPGAVSYASADAAVVAFEKHTIRPLLELIEIAYRRFMPHPMSYLSFDTSGFLRGDPKTQMDLWVAAVEAGLKCRDEVRALDGLPPLPDGLGKKFTVPQRTIDLARIDDQSVPAMTVGPDPGAAGDVTNA